MTVCRICLHPGIVPNEGIDQRLVDLHEELCDYDNIFDSPLLSYCTLCEYQLRKCYNFRQKCREAHKILKTCKKKKSPFGNAYKLMPPSSLGFARSIDQQRVYNVVQSELSDEFELTGVMPEPVYNSTALENKIEDVNSHLVLEAKIDFDIRDSEDSVKNDDDFYEVEFLESDFDDENTTHETVEKPVYYQTKAGSFALKESNEQSENLKKSLESDEDDVLSANESLKDENSANESNKNEKPVLYKTKAGLFTIEELNDERVLDIKEKIVKALDEEPVIIGQTTINAERFLQMFKKYDKGRMAVWGLFKKGPGEGPRIKRFLQHLHRFYNPEFEAVFDMQYMNTRQQQLEEFQSRAHSQSYLQLEFKCHKCYRGFETESMLDYHNKWHEEARPHVCSVCPMRFPTRRAAYSHWRIQHHAVYSCKLCPLVTHHTSVMVNHYQQHQGVRFKCDECPSEFCSVSAYNMHRQKHGQHACVQCNKRFASAQGLKNHEEEKHSAATLLCDKCDDMFVTEADLRRHARQKHKDITAQARTYECRVGGCMRWFAHAESRVTHEVVAHATSGQYIEQLDDDAHVSPDGVACEECGKRFTSSVALSCHKRCSYGNHKKTYACMYQDCGEKFPSREARRAHAQATRHFERRRRGAPPRVRGGTHRTCPICQEQVPNKSPCSLYLHHVKQHPAEHYVKQHRSPGHLCTLCGKTFECAGSLSDHMHKHAGVRPYSCRECPAAFHSLNALHSHSERHRPWRHKCNECGKMFGSSGNLSIHIRTHIGDRRFKCSLCGKGFLHRTSLREHVNGVHLHIRRVKKKPVYKKLLHEMTADNNET